MSRDCAETIRLLREENGALRVSDRRQRGELARLRPLADAVKPLEAELARLRRDQVTRMLSSEFPLIPLAAPVYRMPAVRRVLEDQIIAQAAEITGLRAEVRAACGREKALLRAGLVHDGGGLARSPMHAVLGRVSMTEGTADGEEAGHGSGAAGCAAARRGGDLAARRDW
ncbi:MAG TPA: hypothetical protein VGS19_01185 [Streptosporangiaceae bacterium]|nr:hypothetical protein [Streptosporangiaceae bacterium]